MMKFNKHPNIKYEINTYTQLNQKVSNDRLQRFNIIGYKFNMRITLAKWK